MHVLIHDFEEFPDSGICGEKLTFHRKTAGPAVQGLYQAIPESDHNLLQKQHLCPHIWKHAAVGIEIKLKGVKNPYI